MRVSLRDLDITSDEVERAVAAARVVGHALRRRDADRPLDLVTDSIAELRGWYGEERAVDDTPLGCTYYRRNSCAVWLSPAPRDRVAVVRTMCHELAHVLGRSGVVHAPSFRRLHVCLAAVVPAAFGERLSPRDEAWRVVARYGRYRRLGPTDRLDRRLDEVEGHVRAALRLGHVAMSVRWETSWAATTVM